MRVIKIGPPNHERLCEWLSYDPESGAFSWNALRGKSNRKTLGRNAGCIRPDGYRVIGFEGVRYLSGRLAWFYIYKEWPEEIDHINMIRSDDRIRNLRSATSSQNKMNKIYNSNKTGFAGVWYSKITKRYNAHMKINNKTVHIGSFDTPKDAHAAYLMKAKEIHGEFVRVQS